MACLVDNFLIRGVSNWSSLMNTILAAFTCANILTAVVCEMASPQSNIQDALMPASEQNNLIWYIRVSHTLGAAELVHAGDDSTGFLILIVCSHFFIYKLMILDSRE